MSQMIKLFVVRQTLSEDSYTINIQFGAWFRVTDVSPLASIQFNTIVDSLFTGNMKRFYKTLISISF